VNGDGRITVKENEVGTEKDVPHVWVIEVVTSIAGARKLGKVLGENGFTGKFIDGDIAGLARDGALFRKLKGGDEVGKTKND
jgi:hypothetical protein